MTRRRPHLFSLPFVSIISTNLFLHHESVRPPTRAAGPKPLPLACPTPPDDRVGAHLIPEARLAILETRPNQDSSNASRPLSSDAPHVRPDPHKTPSGKRKGGQPGHLGAPAWAPRSQAPRCLKGDQQGTVPAAYRREFGT